MMQRELVRNHAVFCLESRMRNVLNDKRLRKGKYKSIAQVLKNHSKEEILSKVCLETKPYSEMLSLFASANESQEDNDMFVFAFRLDDDCFIKVDRLSRIIIYYYQDRYRIDGESLFPWDYPHKISCLGVSKNKDNQALIDFLELNVIDYFLKYTPNLFGSCQQLKKNEADGIYVATESLSILLDSQIVLHITDQNGCVEKRYIADTWWYNDAEILSDLLNMSIFEFGKKYTAYWY